MSESSHETPKQQRRRIKIVEDNSAKTFVYRNLDKYGNDSSNRLHQFFGKIIGKQKDTN